jgi:hypothetical protein
VEFQHWGERSITVGHHVTCYSLLRAVRCFQDISLKVPFDLVANFVKISSIELQLSPVLLSRRVLVRLALRITMRFRQQQGLPTKPRAVRLQRGVRRKNRPALTAAARPFDAPHHSQVHRKKTSMCESQLQDFSASNTLNRKLGIRTRR